MNSLVKVAIIVGLSLVACTAVYMYLSPYHSCVRALEKNPDSEESYLCWEWRG